jgi:metallo-beta-lactamase family protein
LAGYSYGMPRLTFLGAAQTVTGSKYLLETGGTQLLVDCGLFQGLKSLRERNWTDLPVDAASIHAVVLTHAHLDHTGYLPRLVAQGFRGRIFCTPGTADLCRLVLPDAARLQEEDAREANRQGYSKHAPALPLFTETDAFRALTQLQPVGFHRPVPAAAGVEVSFSPTGHLLGAAAVTMTLEDGRRIVFGGDLGRYDRPVLRDPDPVSAADVLLIESTYGDRRHEPDDHGARFGAIVRETIARNGKVVIPAFAIGRVEEILYWLKRLEEAHEIPVVPVFVDSPMAVEALGYYGRRVAELDDDMREAGKPLASFATRRFQTVSSAQQSAELVASKTPAVIVSASGMATGGRVLHHLKRVLPDSRNTVLFVGYQAAGTRGRALVDGAREVKIHGQFIPVSAGVERIDAMSAHADRAEIVRWLRGFSAPPAMTYIVHGEPPAMRGLQTEIARELGPAWTTRAPEYLETAEI